MSSHAEHHKTRDVFADSYASCCKVLVSLVPMLHAVKPHVCSVVPMQNVNETQVVFCSIY